MSLLRNTQNISLVNLLRLCLDHTATTHFFRVMRGDGLDIRAVNRTFIKSCKDGMTTTILRFSGASINHLFDVADLFMGRFVWRLITNTDYRLKGVTFMFFYVTLHVSHAKKKSRLFLSSIVFHGEVMRHFHNARLRVLRPGFFFDVPSKFLCELLDFLLRFSGGIKETHLILFRTFFLLLKTYLNDALYIWA